MNLEHGFYSNSDNSRFVLRSINVCGKGKSSNHIDLSDMSVEDHKLKLIKFVKKVNDIKDRKDENDLTCLWWGSVFNYSGYSTMNRNFVRELMNLGVGVRISRLLDFFDCSFSEIEPILEKSITKVKPGAPLIWGQVSSSPQFAKGNSKSVHFTMSEFEGKYNKRTLDSLSKDDEVWVPTDWDANKLLDSGFKNPVLIFPLGVDTSTFLNKKNEIQYSSGTNSFKFISVMSWNWRKGYDVLLKAFFKKFSSTDDVSLILFTREFLEPNSQKELFSMIGGLTDNSPHVVQCQSVIPTFAMPYVYSDANAFVSFPRGEGWGLPLMEAASCGLPIISSYQGGQKTFLNKEDSFLIEPDMIVPASERMKLWSALYDGTYFADYSERVIDEAAEKMRYVYDNFSEAKKKSDICTKRIRENFDWKQSTEKVYNRIRQLI